MSDTKTVDVLADLRKIADGEGDAELLAMRVHAAIAEMIDRERVMRAALHAVKQWNDVSGLDEEWPVVMEQVDAALAAVGGAP